MVYESDPKNFIQVFNIFPAAELVEIRFKLKIHNIQIIANDFNGSNSLFSQIVSNFLSFSLVRL